MEMSEETRHDLHYFMQQLNNEMEQNYQYLQKRAKEDPGTTGDQAEEHWAEWLREWLPPTYKVVTKGRIIDQNGEASPQIDILVLKSFYPEKLHSNKHYLSVGVVAAFECKTTLRANHIQEAIVTCEKIKSLYRNREGSPYKELHAPIIYGLLAHSHNWKAEGSKPEDRIMDGLFNPVLSMLHPRLRLDLLCVADYGTWVLLNTVYLSTPVFPEDVSSGYLGFIPSHAKKIEDFTAIGSFYANFMERLAWEDPTLRDIVDYYRLVRIGGESKGGQLNRFSFDVFSNPVQEQIRNHGLLNDYRSWSEWNRSFGDRMVFRD